MKYQIDRENYHTFSVFQKNKLPARSYMIPYPSKEEAAGVSLLEKRYASSKVQCLNGSWDFRFYHKPSMLPGILDTDNMTFDTIDVPSCWQFRGYMNPFYVNTRYQFPYDPPRIPKEEPVGKTYSSAGSDLGMKPRWQKPENEYNSVGVYRKKFTLPDNGKQRVISFLGVASCLDLYVNGCFVGYSEGSHNTAEFDLTAFLQSGENELVAVVHRWCTGTYLECQDMFRNNGIFRDVLLYEMDAVDFWDVECKQQKTENGYRAIARAELNADAQVKFTLSGHGLSREITVATENKVACASFDELDVLEWNAETPVLYDLYMELPGSCVKMRIGFRQIAIQGDVFTLNGQKLKLKGVNHHDTSCRNGYYLTPREILRDVQLCKEYNMDTIRTSHYPPDPLLLECCDELGVYVVDEADLETHGTVSMRMPPNFGAITHDKKWEAHYLDRVQRLYGRDRSHSCIIMWSLGNEAGGYNNTDAMYRWLKERTEIPVHYESVIHSKRIAYDVGSEMYPPVEKVHLVGEHKRKEKQLNDRPYFMCEYAHAMGVGPGGVEEYWQEIYNYDNLMGGCVWEMIDHAVLHGDGSYTYGGDHGEWMHDGNFCVDGLFYPDRTPSTGAKLIRHIYRPIRVRHLKGSTYELFNTLAFTPSGSFDISFCFSDGSVQKPNIIVPPLSRLNLELSPCDADSVTVVVKNAQGYEVSREQIVFRCNVISGVQAENGLPDGLDIQNGKVVYKKDGKCLSVSEQQTILFRAPTDNDVDFFMNTAMDDYLVQYEEIIHTAVEQSRIVIASKLYCKKQIFLCTDIYENCSQGILVTSRLQCIKGKGNLPRFGKAYRLDSSFDSVTYVGRNGESFCDMKEHTQIEHVQCTVSHMTEPNIRPQESGNRCDCSYAAVSDGTTAFSFTAVDSTFELGIKPYSDWELLDMRHRCDEVRSGTYVTVSAFQMGIGTGSCGPATLPKYCYPANQEYVLRFIIK